MTFGNNFLNKFAANHTNVYHLTWIMSRRYLVKLALLIALVLPIPSRFQRKRLETEFKYGLRVPRI